MTLLAVFAATRIVFALTGGRFDDSLLRNGWQYLDPRLLRHDLFRSLWYLHSQPPLFNLFLGAVVHVPTPTSGTLQVLFLLTGAALVVGLYLLMLELATPRAGAWIGALLFSILPATFAYENYALYTYAVATMLCWSALAVARYARTRRVAWGVATVALLSAVALTRASYHLIWLVVAVGLLLFAVRPPDRRAVIAMMLPVLVVAGWYLKNFAVFGTFSSSSWVGMNMAHTVFSEVPRADLERLVAEGKLSRDVLVGPFKPLSAYGVAPGHTGVPALDELRTSTGLVNLNNKGYIKVSSRMLHDDLTYARDHPGAFLADVTHSLRLYFLPAQQYPLLVQAHEDLPGLGRVTDRALNGQLQPYDRRHGVMVPGGAHWLPQLDQIAWLTVLEYGMVILAFPCALWALFRRRRVTPTTATVLLVGWTVLWTVVVDNVFDFGENNRFRYETDAVVGAVAIALACAGVRALQRRRSVHLQTQS